MQQLSGLSGKEVTCSLRPDEEDECAGKGHSFN